MSVAARPLAGRVRVERSALPVVVLALGALAVALVSVLTALDVTVWASFDEAVYQASAVHYTHGLPGSLIDDPAARGIARLPSLLITPFYVLFEGDTALRLSRAFNGVLWAATAVPLYALARTVIASPWRAVAAALLSVAVPWVTISTVLFSEALSYLLFACAVLAMVHALRDPAPWRDALVLVLLVALVTTRVQFVALFPAWLLVVVLFGWRDRRRALRRFPFLLGGAALALLLLLAFAVLGGFRGEFDRFAGPYSELQNRTTLPGDAGLATLWEVGMLSLGIGLIPAALCAGWLREALAGRASVAARRLAVLSVVLVVVLFAATMFAQGGWLDAKSEERYYLYAIPLLWIGALAALELRDFPARWVAFGAGVLAALLFVLPITVSLTSEQAFLGPVSGVASKLLGTWSADLADAFDKERVVSTKDLLGWIAVLVAVLGTLAWRRARWLALVPAVVIQLGITAYAFSAMHGNVEGVGGATGTARFADLAWVDRALPGEAEAVLLDNAIARVREPAQRLTAFWNADVSEVTQLQGAGLGPVFYPVDSRGVSTVAATPDLRLRSPLAAPYAVTSPTSPFWHVHGEVVRESPDPELRLVRVIQPAQLTWASQGLDPDGQMVRPVRFRAAPGVRIHVILAAPGDATRPGVVRWARTGAGARTLSAPGSFTIATCGAPGVVTGTMAPVRGVDVGEGRRSAAVVDKVTVAPC